MATTNLSKPQIINSANDILRIKHPDISGNLKTYLTASIAAAGTTATVSDNSGWADNDWFILGNPGEAQTEETDINGSPTRGTSLTITNTLKFAHQIDTPMTQIYDRSIEVAGATTLAGTKTLILQAGTAVNIQWDKSHTEIDISGTQYAFYFVRFYDGTNSGDYSQGIARTGLTNLTAEEIIQNALNLTGEKFDTDSDGNLTREKLLDEVNNWQDDVTSRREWSFETTNGTITSAEGVNENSLSDLSDEIKYSDNNRAIISVRFGDRRLNGIDWKDYHDEIEGHKNTTVASAITAADTSITLTDTYEFASSGQVAIGSDTTITYTTNTKTTGVLSGIPASGSGSIAASHAVGDQVWQGVGMGRPDTWTIYNGTLFTDVPVSSTFASIKIKLRYYKKLSRLDDFTDTTAITFAHIGQYFIASRIEYAKGNHDRGDKWLTVYETKLRLEVKKDRQPQIKRFVPARDNIFDASRGRYYRSTESSRYNNS